MKNKVINIKFAMIFILVILFVFVLNYNETFARTISFDLKDGTISIIQDNIEDEEDEENKYEEDNETNGDIEQDEEKPEEDDEIVEEGIIKEGAYIISCSANNEFVLDVSGPSTDNTAKVHIWQRTEAPNQKFYITYEGDGYYKIASINSAKILDVPNASKESELQLQQYENNDTEAQRFKIIENEDGTYSFIAKCSGLAIDVQTGIYENGRIIQQYEVNGTEAQKFNLEKTELINEKVNSGIISIKTAKNPNMQLDMINCSSEEGNKVHLWQESATLAQRYEMHRVGENEIRIRTAASGGFLKGSSNEKGSDVVQIGNSATGVSDSDTWKVEWDEGIILVNKETGLAITVNGDINTNGTQIKLMDKVSDDTQRLLINTECLIPNGYFTIESKYGTMLDFPTNSQGTHLQTWNETGTFRQIFKITCENNGYKINAPLTGFVVDVYAGSMDNAAIVQMEIDAGTTSQRWTPELLDGGYITFRNVNSGLMLNVHLFNNQPGAVINQGLEDHSEAQLWRLNQTTNIGGWVNTNGNWYCYDPQTGELVKNCTRVDPMMTDPNDYGSIYDFDSEGRATWHLPVESDLQGGTGPSAPIPTVTGDKRQRLLQVALSRLGCPYVLGGEPTGFVCDGLTSWSYSTAIEPFSGDASWQWDLIKNHNGLKYDLNEFKSGDFVFFGDSALTQGAGKLTYKNPYHAGIYYKDGIMLNSTSTVSPNGVCFMKLSDYYLWNKFLGGGSPYGAETSKVEIHK